eukprot:8088730-Pyramimonas_sp.AAC.1
MLLDRLHFMCAGNNHSEHMWKQHENANHVFSPCRRRNKVSYVSVNSAFMNKPAQREALSWGIRHNMLHLGTPRASHTRRQYRTISSAPQLSRHGARPNSVANSASSRRELEPPRAHMSPVATEHQLDCKCYRRKWDTKINENIRYGCVGQDAQ